MAKDKRRDQAGEGDGGLMETGVKKSIWLHRDEAEALRLKAFQERRSEASIVREALRRLLGIED